ELSFRSRRRLLLSLGEVGTERAVMGEGHRRRTQLAVCATRKVLPVWDSVNTAKHPHQLLDGCEKLLSGEGDREQLRTHAYNYSSALQGGAPPDERPALYVGHAAVCAAFVAVDDEIL